MNFRVGEGDGMQYEGPRYLPRGRAPVLTDVNGVDLVVVSLPPYSGYTLYEVL